MYKKRKSTGKRETATPRSGQGLAGDATSRQCNNCAKLLGQTFWRCTCCKLVGYCNEICQRAHWSRHKTLCNAIKKEIHNKNETVHDNRSEGFMSYLTPKEYERLINLVGRRCTVSAKLNGKTVEVLWDTGAQVSIVSADFLMANFPNLVIRDVGELINCDLTLTAANGNSIPYKGWVELEFQIGDSGNTTCVPFLVANEKLRLPLLGFNVIEHLIKVEKLDCSDISPNFLGTKTFNAPALVEFVNNVSHVELCSVKTGKKDVVIPRGQTVKVSCGVNTGPLGRATPVLFAADENGQWGGGGGGGSKQNWDRSSEYDTT